MPRRQLAAEIARLDPIAECDRILALLSYREFPFDIVRSTELALYRQFADPEFAGILEASGELLRHPQKSYDDAQLIMSEIFENGPHSERGRRATARLNQIHAQFTIRNELFLYGLSAFALEPIRWLDRFGWRRLTEHERLAMFSCWIELAQGMGITDLPGTLAELERFNVEWERTHFASSPSTRRMGVAGRELFLRRYVPRPFWPLGAVALHALLDDAVLDAFGFSRPPLFLRRFVAASLRLRARIVRVLPERRIDRLLTSRRHATYPHGYEIEDLGPK